MGDQARDEMVNTPTTMPADEDQVDDEQDEQMMDFEDELDRMEDAFANVQSQYADDDEQIQADKHKRKWKPCKGTPAFIKVCKKFRHTMKMLRKEKKEIRSQMKAARKSYRTKLHAHKKTSGVKKTTNAKKPVKKTVKKVTNAKKPVKKTVKKN